MRIKKLLLLLSLILFFYVAQSQVLFTYGTKTVTKDEFLKAYNKTPNQDSDKQAALRQYLNLYINFKLKVQAAYDEKLNQQPGYKTEAANFKSQLTENRINEQANVTQLLQEAFERSMKDIHLEEIFIQTSSKTDTADAFERITKAYNDLNNGTKFEEVVTAYSSDEALKQSNGDIGFITVFTLPYEIENIIYALQPGSYSKPYHSNIGYHIFKNIEERHAVGKRTVTQILFPFVPSSSEAEKQTVKQKADSVYQLILQGADFIQMQQQFGSSTTSDENTETFEVAVGKYSSDFENHVFALEKVGDVSKPFETAYGYNIIKVKDIKPVSTDSNDVVSKGDLQQQVEKDNRLSVAKKNLVNKWFSVVKYKPAFYNAEALWKYTDSALNRKPNATVNAVNKKTVLFSFEKQNITANDWIIFLEDIKGADNTSSEKSYPAFMNEFINYSCGNYYRSHLDEYDEALNKQIKEFNEANLLFAAMDKHVWSKAGEDSLGLLKYYKENLGKYKWAPSVSALVITAATGRMANEIATKIKANAANWRSIIKSYGNAVTADSSRFEESQLPVQQPAKYESGFISQPQKNTSDDTYTFVYIMHIYPQTEQRSFEEARGIVINDYQEVEEAKWIASLKQKYPVKINEEVFKSIK